MIHLIKLSGSIDILGSPIQFFGNVETGFNIIISFILYIIFLELKKFLSFLFQR